MAATKTDLLFWAQGNLLHQVDLFGLVALILSPPILSQEIGALCGALLSVSTIALFNFLKF